MKRSVGRLVAALALGWCGLAAFGAIRGGFFVPPVVAQTIPVRSTGPKLDASRRVEFTLGDGVVLVGIHESVEPGARLVVHFMDSGGSVFHGYGYGDRFDRLADRGFASLAFDYRGTGNSGGRRDAARLVEDAEAVYRHALSLVEGDESRLVLRATSIGTVVVAGLLQGGARPAAVVAYAPVEARTVARRFSAQVWWGLVYWPLAPLLRDLVPFSSLETLMVAPCPVFVTSHADDCFVTDDEVEALRRSADAVETVTFEPFAFEGEDEGGFDRHMSIVHAASQVGAGETRFLEAHVPAIRVAELRVERILDGIDIALRERIETDPATLARLHRIARMDRLLYPVVAAAAAIQLRDDEVEPAREWISSTFVRFGGVSVTGEFDPFPVPCPRSQEELLGAFALDDGAGERWPVNDVLRARELLECLGPMSDERLWSGGYLRALALAMDGDVEAAARLAEETRASFDDPEAPWLAVEQQSGGFVKLTTGSGGSSSSRVIMPVLFRSTLESRLRQLKLGVGCLPLLRKAAWLP